VSRTIAGPAAEPCRHCPFRRDVPSGVWAPEEYAKLVAYDADTALQPTGLFLCHLRGKGEKKRVCAGAAGCYDGEELLALRLATATGEITPQTAQQIRDYSSPIPLFATGAEAAAHGLAEVESPGPAARAAMEKIARSRRWLGEFVYTRNGVVYTGPAEETEHR
jgi:hypothetical protein